MGVGISYMGTKREIAPAVREVVSAARSGPLLDAFAGMCSVAEEVGTSRQVWTNDVQIFAAEVGRALFTSRDDPMSPLLAANLHYDSFDRHRARLTGKFRRALEAEDEMLLSTSFGAFAKMRKRLAIRLKREVIRSRKRSRNLFTLVYSDSYFGVRQAIEADAIVESIDRASKLANAEDRRRWLLIALGRALLKVANSTGHFAQYLKPNEGSFQRFLSQRRRSLWAEWLFSIGELSPVGTSDWRRRNRGFNDDALPLLTRLEKARDYPSVIYADPPYTDDQYSRFYHIFETLFLYDYPVVSGAGLYRPNRFATPFSLKSKAPGAFRSLVKSCARIGADLVLSYPTNGLLCEAGTDIENLLRGSYGSVERCYALPHDHSTFGASKGSASAEVTELIYLAKSCRQ